MENMPDDGQSYCTYLSRDLSSLPSPRLLVTPQQWTLIMSHKWWF